MTHKFKPPQVVKTELGVRYVDAANLLLYALDQPVPSPSALAFMAQWHTLDNDGKLAAARTRLVPLFILDDLISHTRVTTRKRAGELLNEHIATIRNAIVPVNVATDEKPKLIATAFGAQGALAFLKLLNTHRGSKKGNKAVACRALADGLAPLCKQRTTEAKAARLVSAIEYLVELHGYVEHLARSASLHQQLAIATEAR